VDRAVVPVRLGPRSQRKAAKAALLLAPAERPIHHLCVLPT